MANQTTLSFFETHKINDLFKKQKWPVDEGNKSSLYNRFLLKYEQLDDEERELFIKLSSLYKWISLSEYQELVITLLEIVLDNCYPNKAQDVWIYPIKQAEHHGVIKSSDVVAYLCRSMQIQYRDHLYKRKFHVMGSLKDVCQKKSKFQERPLLIVDDFIGSGQYASDVIDELASYGIPLDNVVVCSLFISELGYKRLSDKGCKLEYIELVQSVLIKLSPREKELLIKMEESLGVKAEFHFGYGESANLISLLRTPNNSLPIFWLDRSRSHLAPFPR